MIRGVSSRGAYALDESNQEEHKYAPDEIQNSMFLPLMKNVLMGAYGADA